MAGILLIHSLDKGERVYYAMVARGYDGEVISLPSTPMTLSSQIVFLSSTTLFCII